MYFTALWESMIHPGSGDMASNDCGARRTPVENFSNTWGPLSMFPFFIKLPTKKIVKFNY